MTRTCPQPLRELSDSEMIGKVILIQSFFPVGGGIDPEKQLERTGEIMPVQITGFFRDLIDGKIGQAQFVRGPLHLPDLLEFPGRKSGLLPEQFLKILDRRAGDLRHIGIADHPAFFHTGLDHFVDPRIVSIRLHFDFERTAWRACSKRRTTSTA